VPADKCLAFTDTKLRENFSNYSAWHARSALLTVIFWTVWQASAPVVLCGGLPKQLQTVFIASSSPAMQTLYQHSPTLSAVNTS
jgi:hypothetical protein